jgi:manganese efflux pump family protein
MIFHRASRKMSPAAVFILSVSMSADAFAVSVGRGAAVNRTRLAEALRTGIVFGTVEALTPFLGWLAGIAAAGWVSRIDHWLAFGLLLAVGLHMSISAVRSKDDEKTVGSRSFLVLLATALGTSIDAMAIGLSLAFLDFTLYGIVVVSLAIGFATFVFSTLGMLLGNVIGDRFGKTAEFCAGILLCGLGTLILIDHLTA